MRAAPRSAACVAMLLGLSSFGPVTMSIYTPIMPLIGTDLATGADAVKFTLTTYMLGFAVGQLSYGPLSDRSGCRPVFGVAFFTLTSIGCAFAPSLGGFLGERYGWRATFWFVGAFGLVLLACLALFLGETNRYRSERIDLGSLTRGAGEMLRGRRFPGYALTLGFAFAIDVGMLAGTPFILQDRLGFSPREFGLIVLVSVAGFASGDFVNNR